MIYGGRKRKWLTGALDLLPLVLLPEAFVPIYNMDGRIPSDSPLLEYRALVGASIVSFAAVWGLVRLIPLVLRVADIHRRRELALTLLSPAEWIRLQMGSRVVRTLLPLNLLLASRAAAEMIANYQLEEAPWFAARVCIHLTAACLLSLIVLRCVGALLIRSCLRRGVFSVLFTIGFWLALFGAAAKSLSAAFMDWHFDLPDANSTPFMIWDFENMYRGLGYPLAYAVVFAILAFNASRQWSLACFAYRTVEFEPKLTPRRLGKLLREDESGLHASTCFAARRWGFIGAMAVGLIVTWIRVCGISDRWGDDAAVSRAIERAPRNYQLYLHQANGKRGEWRLGEAISLYRMGLQFAPRWSGARIEAMEGITECYAWQGLFGEAVEELSELAALCSEPTARGDIGGYGTFGFGYTVQLRARFQYLRGNLEEAESDFTLGNAREAAFFASLKRRQPSRYDRSLVLCLIAEGKISRAEDALAPELKRVVPYDYLPELGLLRWRQGRFQEADDGLREFSRHGTYIDRAKEQAALTRAAVMEALGRNDEAKEAFQRWAGREIDLGGWSKANASEARISRLHPPKSVSLSNLDEVFHELAMHDIFGDFADHGPAVAADPAAGSSSPTPPAPNAAPAAKSPPVYQPNRFTR